MADSLLYTKLKGLDKGLANVYFSITGDDPNYFKSAHKRPGATPKSIGAKDAESIVVQALNGDTITNAELDALLFMFVNLSFDQQALAFLNVAFMSERIAIGLGNGIAKGRGAGRQLKTDAELQEVYEALDFASIVGSFYSPGTKLTYAPHHFKAMKDLVKLDEIHVYEVEDKGVVQSTGVGASYVPSTDMMLLYVKKNRVPIIAHEMTHAVQDWLDMGSHEVQHIEADAYLLMEVAAALKGAKVDKSHPYYDAVNLMMKNKAQLNNADWVGTPKKPGAYDRAVVEVAKRVGPDAKKMKDFSTEQGKGEATKMADALKKLGNATKPAKTTPPPPAKNK